MYGRGNAHEGDVSEKTNKANDSLRHGGRRKEHIHVIATITAQ